MNVFGCFIFLFIAVGIFGPVNGYEETFERSEIVPYHLSLLGYANTTIVDIEKYDAELCMKNGGHTAYDVHSESMDQLSNCVSTVFAEVNHESSVEAYPSEEARENDYFVKVCKRVPDFENCYKNVTEDLKICLDPDKHESTNIIYSIGSSLMNFVCEDGATRFKTLLVAEDFRACVNSKQQELTDCANQTIFKYIKDTIPNGAAVGGIGSFHLLIPDAKKCTVLETFRLCIVEVLRTCNTSKPADLASSMLALVREVTTCDQYNLQSKVQSQASPTPVVNALLITAAMAISLRLGRNKGSKL